MAIVTDVGESVIANAVTQGEKIDFTDILVGDGGGSVPAFTGAETALVNQVTSIAVTSVFTDPKNPNYIHIEGRIPFADGGYTIREAAALDAEGNLVIIGSYPEIAKPADTDPNARELVIRLVAVVSNTAAITLVHDAAEPGGVPERYLLEAGQIIPNSADVSLAEDGKAYIPGPISRALISTFGDRSNLGFKIENRISDLGNGYLAHLYVLYSGGDYKAVVSFLNYDENGTLSRIHDGIVVDDRLVTNYTDDVVLVPIKNTTKVVVVARINVDNLHMKIVDLNNGSPTISTEQVFPGSNIVHITGCSIISENDTEIRFMVISVAQYDGDGKTIKVFSLNKASGAIAELANSDFNDDSTWSARTPGHLYRLNDSNAVYVGDDGKLTVLTFEESVSSVSISNQINGYTSRTGTKLPTLYQNTETELLLVFDTAFNFLIDEGILHDSRFWIARTLTFSSDFQTASFGDEFRIRKDWALLRDSGGAAKNSVSERISILPIIGQPGSFACIDDQGMSVVISVDFSLESIELHKSAFRAIEDGAHSIYPFGEGYTGVVYESPMLLHDSFSLNVFLAGTITPIGLNQTGNEILKGQSFEVSSYLQRNKVFTGYSELIVGQIYSNRIEPEGTVKRMRAVSPEVLAEDSPTI